MMTNLSVMDVRSSHMRRNYPKLQSGGAKQNYFAPSAKDAGEIGEIIRKRYRFRDIHVPIKDVVRKSFGDIGKDRPANAVTRTSKTCSYFRGRA